MFTCNQINEIRKKLILLGIKDTQLPDANKLSGDEIIVIVQEGENKKASISSIINLLSGISVDPNSDFLNISKDNADNITLSQAINNVNINNRSVGQVITFREGDGVWSTYQFTGNSLDTWNNISLWKNITGSEILDIDSINTKIESNTSDINSLESKVSSIQDKDSETDAAISEIQSKVSTLEDNQITVDSEVTDFSKNPVTSEAIAKRIDSALLEYDSFVTDIRKELESQISEVENSLNDITNKIKVMTFDEYNALTDKDSQTIYFLIG